MRHLRSFNVAVVIGVEAYDSDDAQATVNAFLQRDDGELDDGTAIVVWRFPTLPVENLDEDARFASLSIPGIPEGEVGTNRQKPAKED